MDHKPVKYLEDWGSGNKTTRFLRKVRAALTPRNQLLASTLSNGAIVLGRNRPGHGGRGAYVFRDELEHELLHLEHFLDSEGVFIDIGANTGVFSLKAAKHYGGNRGVVVAIEPTPIIASVLFQSVLKNGFQNMRVRNFALGSKTEAASFWMNHDLPNMFGLDKIDPGAREVSVLTVRLDDLFAWEGLDRLDFVKIDVEGAEEQVLAGAQEVLHRYRPIVCLEHYGGDVPFDMPDYTAYQIPGGINKLHMPNESPKIAVLPSLGYVAEKKVTA
jgi:FkbM family methyltransferase